MANPKQYKVIAEVGVVGFNGVIHAPGDIVSSATAPAANIKAWLRFKQIEEVPEEAPASESENGAASEKKGSRK
jgi:hypothetical protein